MRAARRGQRPKISDTRCIHKNGRQVWLSWLGTWSEPVRRFFFVGRDMTESRLAQETLRESEQLARGIIDTALDAFVQIDEQGRIRDWNAQAENIFGWSSDEVLGKNRVRIDGPAGRSTGPLKTALEAFLLSGDEVGSLSPAVELQVRRRDGKEITVELSIAALRTRDGFVFNAFIRDLTDKIAAEDRIRQAEKMEAVGQLTGGIAHDFNNILTVITGTIEILADAVKGEPQLAAITRMIDEAASRGADLTQHLLAFARKQPLEPKITDVNTLIIDTAKLLQRTLGEHVEIESVFEDEICPAIVDPNQLATAILNLALNARDAMPDGGKLIIETGFVFLDDKLCENAQRRPARPLRHDRGERYRNRHSGRDPRQGVQSVLHLEGARQGHRPRPEHGVRLRQAIGRPHHDLQRGGPRHDDQDVSAAGHRAPCRRPSRRWRRPSRAATKPSWSSKTTSWCATMC